MAGLLSTTSPSRYPSDDASYRLHCARAVAASLVMYINPNSSESIASSGNPPVVSNITTPRDEMMKVLMLLAFASLATAAAIKDHDCKQLVNVLMNHELHMNDTFLLDLREDGVLNCDKRFFCQAEQELKKLSTVKVLQDVRRRLRSCLLNHKDNEKSCKPHKDSTQRNEILLKHFLENIKKCVQKLNGSNHQN